MLHDHMIGLAATRRQKRVRFTNNTWETLLSD